MKLSDFGLAAFTKTIMDEENGIFSTICGTPNYLPPEAIGKQQSGYQGAPADVWSLGVVLYVILIGHLPFLDRSLSKLWSKIRNGICTIPGDLSSEVKDLLTRILCPDPTKRITIDEIQQHPWIKQLVGSPRDQLKLENQNKVRETTTEKTKRIRFNKTKKMRKPYEHRVLTLSALFEERTNLV